MKQPFEKDPWGIFFQLSGQIRVPLSTIQMALKKLAPPEAREKDPVLDHNAALLQKGIFQLMRLAGNLSLASEFGDTTPPRKETVDLRALCSTLTDEVASLGEMRGIAVTFLYEGQEETPFALADREGLRRLLLNLFSNALKFTKKGGSVTMTLTVTEETVSMTVADTGCGIRADLLPVLFDRYQHPERTDPVSHGFGLGLPICHRIAEQHDGTLSAVSMEGVGTQVIFTFPRQESTTLHIREPLFDLYGGSNPLLAELSDALPQEAFTIRHLD